MGLISNEQFLGELAAFYIKSREGGSRNVTVTMKPRRFLFFKFIFIIFLKMILKQLQNTWI